MNLITILISELNEKHEEILSEVLENEDLLNDALFEVILDALPDERSSEILKKLNELTEEKEGMQLEYYYPEEAIADVVVMDIRKLNEEKHEYLKELFGFPDHYWENLDALYDCLSELEDKQIVVTELQAIDDFSLKVLSVMEDVAEEYHNLTLTYDYDELLDEEG